MADTKVTMSDADFQSVMEATDAYIAKMRAVMTTADSHNCGGSLLCNINTQVITALARLGLQNMSVNDIAKAHVFAVKSVIAPDAADEVGPAYLVASLLHSGGPGIPEMPEHDGIGETHGNA